MTPRRGPAPVPIPCRFLPWSEARRVRPPENARWIDVSSYADEPYDTLSPFHPHGGIPVPGMPGRTSLTVEGIWQGLKVIRGRTEPRYFSSSARKGPSGNRFVRDRAQICVRFGCDD